MRRAHGEAAPAAEPAWRDERRASISSSRVASLAQALAGARRWRARRSPRRAERGDRVRRGAEVSVLPRRRRATSARSTRSWRGMDKPTNVLSFPARQPARLASGRTAGRHRARLRDRSSARPRTSARRSPTTIAHLVVHGFLHLIGYDHETDGRGGGMEALETRVLGAARRRRPLRPRSHWRRRRSMSEVDQVERRPTDLARAGNEPVRAAARRCSAWRPLRCATTSRTRSRTSASERVHAQERAILKNVLALHDVRVEDVMVPRADIIALSLDTLVERGARLLPHRRPFAPAGL